MSACYTYDDDGNLFTKASPGPSATITTTFTYDALHRMQTKSYSDGTPAVSYLYDTALPGCLTSVGNSVSSTSYTYGAGCQVQTSTQSAAPGPFVYGYNLAGAMTAEQYPSGRVVKTTYDSAGRATGVCNSTCASGSITKGKPS